MQATKPGRVVIVAGPSGSGKSTLVQRVLRQAPMRLRRSVSATTRPPRPGEVDGQSYHFLSPEGFDRWRQDGEFLECFEVYGQGHWYGTPRREVEPWLAQGYWVLLEIDVNGTKAILRQYPDAVTIFVRTAELEDLERRLKGRGTEAEPELRRRLEVARQELADAPLFQHQVINDNLERAAGEICQVLAAAYEEGKCSTN